MKTLSALIFNVLLLLFCSLSFAANAENAETGEVQSTETEDDPPGKTGGVSDWGLGFGLGVEQYRSKFIETASIHGVNAGVKARVFAAERIHS